MLTEANLYLADETFDALVDRLITAEPTAELPCIRSHVIEALADAGVMPAGLRSDVECGVP